MDLRISVVRRLSAREVAAALTPDRPWWRPALVGALVFADASMVEVLAVKAEDHPGHA